LYTPAGAVISTPIDNGLSSKATRAQIKETTTPASYGEPAKAPEHPAEHLTDTNASKYGPPSTVYAPDIPTLTPVDVVVLPFKVLNAGSFAVSKAEDDLAQWAKDKGYVSQMDIDTAHLVIAVEGGNVLGPLVESFETWQVMRRAKELSVATKAIELNAGAAKANPFKAFQQVAGGLQAQVGEAEAALEKFKGVPGGIPHAHQIGGATTFIKGEQVTTLTFSHPNAHMIFAEGYASLPKGVTLETLGPAPPKGKLPLEKHVERAAVGFLEKKFGARGGIVTTSGWACQPGAGGGCADVWYQGLFPSWMHLKIDRPGRAF